MGDFFIWALMLAIVYMVLNSMRPKEKPPEPEKPKEKPPDMIYSNEFKAQIAVESIKGKSDEDISKDHPSVTAKDIKEWKDDLLNILAKLSENNSSYLQRIGYLDTKVKWLEDACRKNIGDDWKEKTGYKYL